MRKIQVKDIWFIFVVPPWKLAVAIFVLRQRCTAKFIAICSSDFLFSHVRVCDRKLYSMSEYEVFQSGPRCFSPKFYRCNSKFVFSLFLYGYDKLIFTTKWTNKRNSFSDISYKIYPWKFAAHFIFLTNITVVNTSRNSHPKVSRVE